MTVFGSIAAIICLSAVIACGTSLAVAEPATTTWTAYLYQGPGTHYSVVDELPQASQVDLDDCRDGWCKATYGKRFGYLQAEIVTRSDPTHPPAGVLAQPAASVSPLPPSGSCVTANQTGGNGGNAMTVFCRK